MILAARRRDAAAKRVGAAVAAAADIRRLVARIRRSAHTNTADVTAACAAGQERVARVRL